MSGGGGFRGRGFASRGHRRQGTEHHDSRGGNARSQGPSGGRAGFRGGGSRSNAPSDGGNIQGGVGKFRGDGIGGQNRQSFNLPRGPPMRQSQISDNGWSPIPGNNWSGNNWSDNNMGNNWSENNMGNNWSKNNMGNTWMDNNTGNNWPDNNPRNNWSGNNPGNNWSPRGVGPPPPRGFRPWGGGCPTRFNGPPMPSFHRPPYGFQPPIGQNYLPPSIVDYPSNVEPESQNTSKPSNFSPKAPPSKKPAATAPKPQKQIVHPGSEEERLQKITEAADKLKRTLSTNKKGNSTSETWYMDDDIDTFGFSSQQDTDHEPRMANRGIPELKHDPPELNLTLNDLRDIGRVDHDHTSRGTKSSNDADPNVDESEVEILEHNPVERVPEATIDIDLWPEDDPEDTNQLVETNDDTGVFDDTFESTIQPFVDDTSKILHDDIPLTAERDDSKCGDETIPKENENAPECDEQVTEDSAQDNQQTFVNDDTQNVQLDDENIVGETPSSQTEEETKIFDEHYHEHLHDKNLQMEEATIEDVSIHQETRTETEIVDENNVVEDIVLSTVVETEQIDDDDIEKCENSKISTESSVEIGETTSKTSTEENIDDESKMEKIVEVVEAISDEKTNTSDSIKETRDETNISLEIHDEVESEKTTTDEKTLEIAEEMTIESEKLVSSDDSEKNNEETYESHVESTGGKEKVVNESAVDTRRSEQNDNNDSCDSVVTNKITEEEEVNTSTMKSDNVETKEITSSDETVEQSQREREAKEKLAADKKKMIDRNAYKISASIEYSSSSRAYRNSPEIKTNIDKNTDSRIREKVKEKCAEVRDNKRSDRAERGHEKSSNSKSERKKLEEADRKSQERRKLVRSGHDNSSSRNRKSTLETTLRNSNEQSPSSSSAGDEASPTVAHHQSQHDQSSVSSRFENPSYASSSSGKRSKEEIPSVSTKFNRKERTQTANITEVREDPIESVLPPAFDPRLSSRERSVLISSSIPMNQDYTMTSGYPPCTMTNLVPSVPTINYAVPVGVPPALQIPPPLPLTATTPIMTTSIEPATNISSICMSDPFAPILPLPNPPPIVLPNELMIQPPLPVGLPPPPPPPAKATINMEAELEDMQEAMEFAKQLMNMNDDSLESPSNDVLDADISDECDFFHMPTFPDLPPIELPPVPPVLPVPVPPVQTVRTDHPTTNKESVMKKIENDNTTGISYGPAPMPEEYQENLSQNDKTGESSGLTEEQLRPKVVFNLNTKSKIINKQHDEWHQQNQPDEGPPSLASFVSAVTKSVVTEIGENRKNKANPTSLVTVTSKEKSRSTNGRMEERNKKHDEQAVSTKKNGKIDSPSYSPRTRTSLEETESRSLTPPKSGIQAKINKRDEDTSRNNRANKSETLKRSLKETPVRSSSNDPQTPESSWKSRVIGRFLKMSKNDIGNMLNNASLRKFDIAMKHLVKERRSSLSLEMRNNEEERMKDADERCYNREEFMDQLSAMLDPSATVDVCNLPTQFIHHLSQVLHLDTMSEFESPHNSVFEKTIGDVSSPAPESSPNSESRKQRLGSRETTTTTTTTTTSTKTTKNDVAHEQDHREKKASKEKHVIALEETASATTATTTIAAGALNKDKVVSTSEKTIVSVLPKPATNSRVEKLVTRAVVGPRSKRRRAARVTVEKKEQSTTINNGQTSIENNSSSLNMADLDDIFSAGIARAKKKSHDLPIVRTAKKNEEEALNPEKKIVPTISCVDPSVVDRVERAAVELDEIFSAGIARAKLASKKVAEAAKSTEEGIEEIHEANDNNVNDDDDDDDDDERGWNSGNLRTSADCLQLSRGRSSSSGKKAASNNEKWCRQIHHEEPVAFRNLTKEEWEAKYSEPSYSTYQREYRAMEALREKRFQRSPSSGSKPDYNAFDINDLGSLKARLGECLSGNLECDENWSESNDLSRVRSINEAMNYTLEFNHSGDESSSTTSSSTSTSSNTSDAEDDEAPPSVTKLLKVIKEREKIAKQKTFNEEIRDEVTAEIERKKREREKVRKRHRTKPKKSSHHRRRREKKGKTRERKKRDRKRSKKQRKSRRSDQDSKGSSSESEDSGGEEEHMSTSSHGRRRRRRHRHHHRHHHQQQQQQQQQEQQQHSPERLLNEDEIKKEVVVKEEPDPEIVQPNENTSATKSVTSVKPVDDSRPASTTSSSSVPSISVAPSTTGQIIPLHQTKTKAQLKQMPVEIAKKLVMTADTNISCEETAKNQAVTTQVTSFNETRENLVKNILPVASEISNVSDESNVSTSATTPPVSIQSIAAPSDDSAFKTNSKKLDIKTYKERARQRQLKQKEEIRLLIENPSSLTQNLLNIPPLTRKKEEEPLLVRSTTETTNAPEVLKDPRLKKLDETSNSRINVVVAAASLDSKVSDSATTSNDVASPQNSTAKITLAPNNIEENPSTPPPSKVSSRIKIKRSNFTNARTNKLSPPLTSAKDLPGDTGKFAHIKSEGRKELKLREKLKRERFLTSTETPETSESSVVVPPTRLKRRKSLVTTEKMIPATELKTNRVPSSSKLDGICDNFGTLETNEIANEEIRDYETPSVSKDPNLNESSDGSKNTMAVTTNLQASPNPGTGSDEPKISDNVDTLYDVNPVISPFHHNSSSLLETTEILKTSTSLEPPTEALLGNISTDFDAPESFVNSKIIKEISNNSTSPDAPKISSENSITDSSSSENLKNSNVEIQRDNTEISNTEKSVDIFEILESRTSWTNVQDFNAKELDENVDDVPDIPDTLEEISNSEVSKINETLEAAPDESRNLDSGTTSPPETSVILSEITKTMDESKALDASEELSKSVESTENEIQDRLPSVTKEMEKNDSILTETSLMPLEMPIEELPVWSLEAPPITSNIRDSHDYSNDSIPFKGFTDETILRRDRVLTEAEITEDSELNTFESVPLNFVGETATSTADNIDLDEITNTEVVDSLDGLPLPYSEQFQNAQDGIETSLPDPLGHTIYTVADEIVDVPPVTIPLEPDQKEQLIEIVRSVAESSLPVDNLSRIDDFRVEIVNTRETVPSPILVVEAPIESKESSIPESIEENKIEDVNADANEANKIEEINVTEVRNEATEETILPEELSINESQEGMKIREIEPGLSAETEASNTDGNVVIPSGNDRCDEIRLHSGGSNDNNFVEDESEGVGEVNSVAEFKNQIAADIESSSKICDTRDDKIDEENATKDKDDKEDKEAETRETMNCHQDKHDSESKSKDSSHHSKEHGHGRVKKKSSRNHNHGSKTSKKTTLTEKLVEDAITANVVRLVPKANSRQTVMARMMEIDVEIHKLMNEKMTLYKMLESGDFTSTESQDSVEKTIEQAKMTSEKVKEMEAGRASFSAPSASKITEETAKKPEAKCLNLEIVDKTKKRKKSPHRESKHRSGGRDSAEPRRERKISESKSLTSSREKSTSLTDLEDTEEKRRKKDKSPARQSSKHSSKIHSSREDGLDVSRDIHKAEKSTKNVPPVKPEKTKKMIKPPTESKKLESLKKSKNREVKSSSEKTIKINRPEHIYSDESNFESLQEPNESSKNQETADKKDHIGSSTGLALLEESLKREMAHHRKTKHVEKRKRKRDELRRSLVSSTVLTASEAKTGLINLFQRKKLKNKENSTSSETRDKTKIKNPGRVSKHVSSIIDAVATNRVQELYHEDSRASPARDETPKITAIQENRGIEDEPNKQRIADEERVPEKEEKKEEEKEKEETNEAEEKEIVSRSPDEPTNEMKKVQHTEETEKTINDSEYLISTTNGDSVREELHEEEKEQEESNHEELNSHKNLPSETEIRDIPKTPDIVEENMTSAEDCSLKNQEDYIPEAEMASNETSVKPLRTESRMEKEEDQEKQEKIVVERRRSVTPEYPEPSALNLTEENTNRNNEERYEVSDVRLANETQEEEKRRAVKIGGKEIIERSDTSSENEEEMVPRSRSRANSRRTKRRGKSRSGTRKDKRSQHKEARSSPSRHDSDEDNHSEDVSSLRRPRSAGNRNANKPRERAGPPSSRRGSRQSEENVKSTRARKREHERSNSRGLSPYDGESSRKRFHSHRPVTPTVSSVTTNDQQSKKKGKKRKRPREMSIEEMMRCKVELIDCKYTYLSPTMHPKILKKLGISRINRYVSPSPITENLSPPVLTRNETPSPPTLSKAVEMEYSRKETDDIIEKIDISQELEKSVAEKKIIEEEMMEDDVEVAELERVRIPTPNECQIVKENVDDDEDDEDEDDDDDNIQIVKVLDENLPITPQGVEEDDVESLKDTEQDESSQIDDNENRPELIAVEEDYDTAEEYEVIDEVTDENEEEPEEIQAEVQVIEPTENQPTAVKENTTEPEQIFQSENSDNENEPRRTRYTVHKGPILDIKVLEDSFLAASEDGAIYRYSQTSNGILNIYKGHEAAVTCIYVLEMPGNRWNLYSGSLDGTFRCYDITTGAQDRLANVGSPVQCMDQGWGIIYIGTKSGHISRYNIKAGGLKGDRLEFSDKSVLALKASAEGPRRVLIVASRNQPITIRDANTGLFLRTICGYKNHTVYSLMRDRNLVYCGTSSTSIPVYDFTNGEQMTQYNAGVGIVCMRLYRQILFAGCYDGNIYVFDTLESKLLCSIPGPGNMLLSMEVVNDEIIAGSKNRQLHSWRMPKKVRALLAERT